MIKSEHSNYKVLTRLVSLDKQKKRGHGYPKALCKKAKSKRKGQ